MTLRLNWTAWLLAAALCAPIGCGDDDDGDHEQGKGDGGTAGSKADSGKPSGGDDDELEIAGEWKGEFGDEKIGVDDWGGAKVVEFDNDDNIAYTQYPEDAEFNPNKFSKLVWTEPTDEGFYYCIADYGLDSLDDAKDSKKTFDADNPEDMGSCGMFAWTKLEPL